MPLGLGLTVALPMLPHVAGVVVNVSVAGRFFVIVMDVSALQSPLGLYEVTRYDVVA